MQPESDTALASGLEVGAIVGYKWVWDNFFIDLNGGYGFVTAKAESDDGEEASSKDSTPILNFNLGWAF